VVDLLAVLNLDEGAGGAADVLEEEAAVAELDLRVVSADAFVEDEYLVGAVPADLGPLLLDREEGGLRTVRLVDNQLELLPPPLLRLVHHRLLLLPHSLLFELLGHSAVGQRQVRELLVGGTFVGELAFEEGLGEGGQFGLLGDLADLGEAAGRLPVFDEGGVFVEAAGDPWVLR
jgi:hypothetical protein